MRHARATLTLMASTSMLLAGLAATETAARAKPAPTAAMVLDWNEIALQTVYPAKPVPVGALYLGMASLATYDAVLEATNGNPRNGRASAPAAAAVAAHDILANYFATSVATLDEALADDLGAIPDSPAKDRGVAIGHVAAAEMIASRANAGHDPNPTVAYTKPATVGIWRPTPPNNLSMAVPWLGFVTPLLLTSPTEIHPDGPDPVSDPANFIDYFNDYEEVRTAGAATGSTRTADQTTTARFFNYNAVIQYDRGLIDLYTRQPDDIVATARTFAMVNASVADALITTWRLKLDVGYWRPITAIVEGDADNNPLTVGDTSWTPLIDTLGGTPAGTPPYPEYPSGHATATNAFTESLARSTGTRTTDLYLYSGVTDTTRHYTSLDTLSNDAFMARIWLGIHFRDAMEDAVYVGSEAARLADQRLP